MRLMWCCKKVTDLMQELIIQVLCLSPGFKLENIGI